MSSVSAPSGAPLAAAALPTPEEVRGWLDVDVKQWAWKDVGIKEGHADILVKQEIDGKRLLDVVTEEKLWAVGMPLGPAGDVMNAVAAIKRAAGDTVPTDGGGAGGAGAGAGG